MYNLSQLFIDGTPGSHEVVFVNMHHVPVTGLTRKRDDGKGFT